DGDDILYGLLSPGDSLQDGAELTPVGHYYLNEAGNSLVNGLSAALADNPAGFGEYVLPRNDDGSSPSIDITPIFGEQGVNFFGQRHTRLFVNNNGNITFGDALSAYTPSRIGTHVSPIIA